MDMTDQRVEHAKFGLGLVTKQTDTAITVRFSGEYGERRFLFPDAFHKYLTLCDASGRQALEREMSRCDQKKQQREEERRQEAAAEMQRLLEERRERLDKHYRSRAKAAAKAKAALKAQATAKGQKKN